MKRSLFVAHSRHRMQCGTTLIESLIALVVLAAGTLTVGRLQTQLGLDVDIARQRSEAVRLGEAELEDLRAWSSLTAASGAPSFAAIENAERVVDSDSGYVSNTSFRIVRSIDDGAFAGAKVAHVDVRWADRTGTQQSIGLDSMIAGVAPAYASALALGPGAISAATRGAFGRAPSVPIDAVNIDGGHSARKTSPDATTALIYANASGDITGRCDGIAATRATRDLSSADLVRCRTGHWLAIAGTIRFSDASPPLASSANAAPLPLSIAMTLDGGDYPAPADCETAPMKTVRYVGAGSVHIDAVPADALPASLGLASWADTGERFAAWQCLVAPRSDGLWSGRASLVGIGWRIGTGSDQHRVCRFTADVDGSGVIDTNIEHPRDYRDVGTVLLAQNFLVVNGSDACPAGGGTVQHQPS